MSITNCAPQVLRQILLSGENSDTMLVSKQLCLRFHQVLTKLWNHFLEEEKKYLKYFSNETIIQSPTLQDIEKKYSELNYEISNTKACLPALRKFKAFFQSPSQDLIEQVLNCPYYQELFFLKFQHQQALNNVAYHLKKNKQIATAISNFRSSKASDLFRFLKKDQALIENITVLPPCRNCGPVLPSELFLTFNKCIEAHLGSYSRFPKEISLCKNLQILIFDKDYTTTPQTQLINLPSLKVVRSVAKKQIYPFAHHHYILTSYQGSNHLIVKHPFEGVSHLELRGEWYNGKDGQQIVLDNISWDHGPSLVPQKNRWVLFNLAKIFSRVVPDNCNWTKGDVIDQEGYFFKFKICKITQYNEILWEKGDNRLWYASSLFLVGMKCTPLMLPEFD